MKNKLSVIPAVESGFVDSYHFNDLDSFWNFINPLGSISGIQNNFARLYRFRGQSDASWELTPSIFRGDVISRYKQASRLYSMRKCGDHAFFEWTLLHSFVSQCDENGLPIPLDGPHFRESLLLEKASSTFNKNSWPSADLLPILAVCQHHGVPTRLLDVTSNSLVACYFAAAGAIRAEVLPDRIAVFCIETELFGRTNSVYQHLRVPGHVSCNLAAQSGSFVLVNTANQGGGDFKIGRSIESIVRDRGIEDRMKGSILKATLPAIYSAEILYRCKQFNVSASVLFPGYEGVSREISDSAYCSRSEILNKIVI